MDERPRHALLVYKVYATYNSLPAKVRQILTRNSGRDVPMHAG